MSVFPIPMDEEDMLALEAGFEALYRAGHTAAGLRLGAKALEWRQAREMQRGVEVAESLFSVKVPEPHLRLVRDLEAS